MTTKISYANGRTAVTCESYAEAVETIRGEYPDAEIGHDGDITTGGDSTLCWADADDAEGDAGRNAVAVITRADAE